MKFDEKYSTARPYIAAFALLRKGSKIAMILRANTGYMDGFYGLPSGKVEYNETFSTSLSAASNATISIASATGTILNDAAEDEVYYELFGTRIPVTGTKWCIGHTLGTSGAMDIIAACEVLKNQKAFGLATTEDLDPNFKSQYLIKIKTFPNSFKNILVSSLGFGGLHAVAEVGLA